ncbi:hypothetical protein GMRT_13353 [Giardia muris]|uniref:Uncharacterized protein n=1 Tax=Giardia muris TaxID=5742 RepID=A0A4Z1SRQ0_GIAMU|nr:hypothetical protein GMRT_13353 [Giardia muris]|eukprot:TNJ26318.1 hypothetical protein GMRT_13353 [Giardia muris]
MFSLLPLALVACEIVSTVRQVGGRPYVVVTGILDSDAYDNAIKYTLPRQQGEFSTTGEVVGSWELGSEVTLVLEAVSTIVVSFDAHGVVNNSAETLEETQLQCPPITNTDYGHCRATPTGNKVRTLEKGDEHGVWIPRAPSEMYTVRLGVTLKDSNGARTTVVEADTEHPRVNIIGTQSYIETIVQRPNPALSLFRHVGYVVNRLSDDVFKGMKLGYNLVGPHATNRLGMSPQVWKRAVERTGSETLINELTFIGSPTDAAGRIYPADQLYHYRQHALYVPPTCRCAAGGCRLEGTQAVAVFSCEGQHTTVRFALHIFGEDVGLVKLIGKPKAVSASVQVEQGKPILEILIGNDATMPAVVLATLLRCLSNSTRIGPFVPPQEQRLKKLVQSGQTTSFRFLLSNSSDSSFNDALALNTGECVLSLVQGSGDGAISDEATVRWLGVITGKAPGVYTPIRVPEQCQSPDVYFERDGVPICMTSCSYDQCFKQDDYPMCIPVDCMGKYGHSRPYFSSRRGVCVSTGEKAEEDGVDYGELFIPQFIPFQNVSVACGKGVPNNSTNVLAVPCICPTNATRYETGPDGLLHMCLDDLVFEEPEIPIWDDVVFGDFKKFLSEIRGKSIFEILGMFFKTSVGKIVGGILGVILLLILIPIILKCIPCICGCCTSMGKCFRACRPEKQEKPTVIISSSSGLQVASSQLTSEIPSENLVQTPPRRPHRGLRPKDLVTNYFEAEALLQQLRGHAA